MRALMVKNLFYTDFQCDEIPFSKSYHVITLPLVWGKLNIWHHFQKTWCHPQGPRNIATVVQHLNLYFSYLFGNIQSLNTRKTPKNLINFPRSPQLLCLHRSNCKLVLQMLNFESTRGICHRQSSLKHTWCLNFLPLTEKLN